MKTRTYRTSETVDFVIVGSGAAGGVLARELAHARLDVVVLEQGPRIYPTDLRHDELQNWFLGGLAVDPLITDHSVYWALGNTPFERQAAYLGLFEHGPSSDELARIRQATHGGWLLGSPETIHSPSASRRPVALRAGRPRRR